MALSRRDMLNLLRQLSLSSLAVGSHLIPFQALARSIAASYINESKSKYLDNTVTSYPARNLFHLNLAGAPSRWYFDHLLKPHDSDGFIPTPAINTQLYPSKTSELDFNSEYKTLKMNGYNFPSLWQFNVAKAGGGMRPMQELQNHMLMIRGCKMYHPGHQINISRQVCPDKGGLSITGLVADQSGTLIPAVSTGNCPSSRAFLSKKGLGVVDIPIDHPDYINYLLETFLELKSTSQNIKEEIKLATKEAQSIIENYALSNNPGSEVLFHEKMRTSEIIKMKLEHLSDVFGELQKKYSDLFSRSELQTNLAGINDFELALKSLPMEIKGKKTLADSLGHFHCEGHYILGDMREVFKKVNRTVLAKQFALAEFCLTEGLCSSIHAGPVSEARWFSDTDFEFSSYKTGDIITDYDATRDLTIFKARQGVSPSKYSSKLNTDTHFLGAVANFHACNGFYLGLSSALLELTDSLKKIKINNSTLFDETIIHVASEFDRDPDPNLCGTSHNHFAGVTTIINGLVKKPLVIGNIYVGTTDGKRPGTRGDAAPVEALKNKVMDFRNMSSSLSEALRVPIIVKRARPVIQEASGEFVSLVEKAKNVEGSGKF